MFALITRGAECIYFQVVAGCASVPAYTVVATFSNGLFSPDSDDVGIFLECLPNNGFKVVFLRKLYEFRMLAKLFSDIKL